LYNKFADKPVGDVARDAASFAAQAVLRTDGRTQLEKLPDNKGRL